VRDCASLFRESRVRLWAVCDHTARNVVHARRGVDHIPVSPDHTPVSVNRVPMSVPLHACQSGLQSRECEPRTQECTVTPRGVRFTLTSVQDYPAGVCNWTPVSPITDSGACDLESEEA